MQFKPEEQIKFNAKIRYLNDKMCKKYYALIQLSFVWSYISISKSVKNEKNNLIVFNRMIKNASAQDDFVYCFVWEIDECSYLIKLFDMNMKTKIYKLSLIELKNILRQQIY